MSKYYFDEEAANKAVQFIETHLTHTKGELAKKPFILQEYQKEQIIKPLFGWKNKEEDSRKYRTAFIFLHKNNSKSTLAAAIILTLLYYDNKYGA